MKSIVTLIIISMLFYSCKNVKKNQLEEGTYRGILTVQDDKKLPFTFDVKNDSTLIIHNAEERIIVDELSYSNDSIIIQTPVFEGYIKAKMTENGLVGSYIKESYDRIVPFKALKSNKRFEITTNAKHNVSGNWETVFSKGLKGEYIAKGIFKQNGNNVTGTFRTTTGDYRYLEGIVKGDSLKLSTFDGAHAFLFVAKLTDSTMVGDFYSGNHWKEPFVAKLNNNYELPSAEKLTYLKDGYDTLEFTFPDENNNLISLNNKRFKNKVVVIQIMGTWCPNCLDESKFLSKYYNENKQKGVEVIALAFEVAKTKKLAFKSVNRLKSKLNIKYPILLARTGSEDKKLAHEKLPMLNHIISFPTTIFIDKKGTVRKIHTGFNGPATGQLYIDFKNEFSSYIEALLKE
jgi:peroxiredoxin